MPGDPAGLGPATRGAAGAQLERVEPVKVGDDDVDLVRLDELDGLAQAVAALQRRAPGDARLLERVDQQQAVAVAGLPDTATARSPAWHPLPRQLCGPTDGWDADRLAAFRDRYPGLVDVRRLTREAGSGDLDDVDGQAFARLGVELAAQYLVRPDGHIGYRSGGTDLHGLERYLARWLHGAGAASAK